jgi:hypothetical protein
MEVDPVAVHEYARVNEAAAAALESIAFPTIGSWHGIAGTLFQARVRALEKRRNELKSAHTRAGSALRTFAVVAEQTQEDMRYRQSQRADAVDRRARIDVRSSHTTDPVELRKLQHERDVCEHDIRAADNAYAKAEQTLLDADKKCAHSIEGLAHLRETEPLVERLEQLPLKDFIAYKSLVEDRLVPQEGLNWNSDGCSDGGRFTGDVALPACQRHDFGYRNDDKTKAGRFVDKLSADARFGQDLVAKAVKDARPKSILGALAAPVVLTVGVIRSEVVYLGVTVKGTPDSTQTDDTIGTKGKKKDKTKSRDK